MYDSCIQQLLSLPHWESDRKQFNKDFSNSIVETNKKVGYKAVEFEMVIVTLLVAIIKLKTGSHKHTHTHTHIYIYIYNNFVLLCDFL
jgi:hypothetical protein